MAGLLKRIINTFRNRLFIVSATNLFTAPTANLFIGTSLVLLALTFVSHGKTLQMYYWVDDWAMAYKVLWPEESPGNMGAGVFGDGGPYRYLVTPFIWLYPLFGFNAFPYFAIGWLLYFLAAFSVYLLARELTQRYSIGLAAGAIFASGYIGSHALYRLTNSYQTVGAALFISLTVWLFAKYLRSKKSSLYWLSLLLYILSIEVFFIRTHGLFLSIFAVSTFYWLTKATKLSVKSLILKQLPFFLIFCFMYFFDSRVLVDSKLVLSGIDAIVQQGQVQLLNNLLITFSNALVPEGITQGVYVQLLNFSAKQNILPFVQLPHLMLALIFILPVLFSVIRAKRRGEWAISILSQAIFILLIALVYIFILWSSGKTSSLWNPRGVELFTSMLGGGLFVTFLYTAWVQLRHGQQKAFLIPLALVWIFANSITLFVYSPQTNLESTSRYLIPAFVGISLLYATTFFLVAKRIAIVLVLIICLVLIYYSNKEASTLLENVSIPDKQGYSLILEEVDKVDEDTVFYIETEDNPRYKGNYLGRLPQLGLSALYKYHGITRLADSYDNLFSLLETKEVKPENTHVYFYGSNGYVSVTSKFRALLTSGGQPQAIGNWTSNTPFRLKKEAIDTQSLISGDEKRTVSISPVIEADLLYDSLVPSVLEVTMTVQSIDLSSFKFPFYDLSYEFPLNSTEAALQEANPKPSVRTSGDIIASIRGEYEKQEFYDAVSVSATSSWKTTEADNLVDRKEDTNWGADNTEWNYGKKPQEIFLKFSSPRDISKVLWINHHHMSTPTVYIIYTSLDGKNWDKRKEVKNGMRREGGEEVVEAIARTRAQFVKFSVYETYGERGYPPAAREIWVSSLGSEIDKTRKEGISLCPFCYIPDLDTYTQAIENFRKVAKARLWWKTNRNSSYMMAYSQQFLIEIDGKPHTYQVFLPAHGTRFNSLKIDGFQVPVAVSVSNVSIRSLTLEEIQKEGLVKTFVE